MRPCRWDSESKRCEMLGCTRAERCAWGVTMQAGPIMVRHVIHGREVLLPYYARLRAPLGPNDKVENDDPLGGTY